MNYIFLGSPAFAKSVLERLAKTYGPPAAVVSQSAKATGRGQKTLPTAVAEFAQEKNLLLFETADINQPEMLERLKALNPDALVVVAFGQILKEPLLSLPRLFSINLHGSLLPKYRGAAPVQRAIFNGDAETGITVQKMVKRLDSGDIIGQHKLAIDPDDTSNTLLEKMIPIGAQLLAESLRKMEVGGVHFQPQDEAKASYAQKLSKADSQIDWQRSNIEIRNQIRATIPWPICEARFDGLSLKILEAKLVSGDGVPGTVITDSKSFLHVQCGQGRLSLTVIQPANRKPLEIAQFFSGFRGSLIKTI